MARQGRPGGPQQPMRGFRPGKEPPQLRKQQAKQQFRDLSPTQEKLVEMFAERTPDQARAMVRRWTTTLLVLTVVVAALAVALFFWSVVAGVIVALVAAVLLYFWLRLRGQRAAFEAMADAISGRGVPGAGGAGGGRRRRK